MRGWGKQDPGAQERFINRNMETCRRSQARQRRMGKSQRDHFEMQTEARSLGGPLCNRSPRLDGMEAAGRSSLAQSLPSQHANSMPMCIRLCTECRGHNGSEGSVSMTREEDTHVPHQKLFSIVSCFAP